MADPDTHRYILGNWAKGLYALAGLKLLAFVVRLVQGQAVGSDLGDPILILLLAAAAHGKTSRSAAVALTALNLLNVASDIFTTHIWLLLAINVLLTIAAAKCAIEAFRFHRVAGTRIVWRNAVVVTCVTLVYCGAIIGFLVMIGGVLPAEVPRHFRGLELFAPLSMILALAIWRKLPGTGAFPAVLANDVDPATIPLGKGAENMRLVTLAAGVEGVASNGDYVVSPAGIFGRRYRLTAEQFGSYVQRRKARVNRGAWIFALFFPAIILGTVAGQFLSGITTGVVTATILLALVIYFAVTFKRQVNSFRREFPDALTVPRSTGGRMDNFLFRYGAGPTGRPWHMGVAGILFLCFAPFTGHLLSEDVVDWQMAIMTGGLSFFCMLSPFLAVIGKRRFQQRYGCILTAESLWTLRSGEAPHPVP